MSPLSRAETNQALQAVAARYVDLLRGALGENLVSAVLFGSVARGEAGPDSDIDLLIVGEEFPPGRFARLRLLEEADAKFEPELDRLRSQGLSPRLARLLKTRAEAARFVPLYLDLTEDARLLYDRDGFFQSVLTRLGASLKRLGAERRLRGQTRYWVLKRDFRPGEVIDTHLRQARLILEEAERHHHAGAWHLVVRRCQETVELALKAALRAAGIEVPHVHDVGVFFLEHAPRFPESLTKHLERVVSISRRLREEREISFYGDEEMGAPPERLYASHDADEALRDARFIVELCESSVPPAPADSR